jgi:hypothetical protein
MFLISGELRVTEPSANPENTIMVKERIQGPQLAICWYCGVGLGLPGLQFQLSNFGMKLSTLYHLDETEEGIIDFLE